MRYDFDQVIDRSKNLSAKYDERTKKFGTDNVIPLWIADMDFKTAQPIIDALKARAEEGLWGYTARPNFLRRSSYLAERFRLRSITWSKLYCIASISFPNRPQGGVCRSAPERRTADPRRGRSCAPAGRPPVF